VGIAVGAMMGLADGFGVGKQLGIAAGIQVGAVVGNGDGDAAVGNARSGCHDKSRSKCWHTYRGCCR
jgi:hypothetical protein